MRSRLKTVSPSAWLALIALGLLAPAAQASSPPNMVSICSESGSRFIELPSPSDRQEREDCVKGCHALCQRKRAATPGGAAGEN